MQDTPKASWKIPPTEGGLEEIRQHLLAWLEQAALPSRVSYIAELTYEEIMTNIIKYGGGEIADVDASCEVEVTPGFLHMVFNNTGYPFDPTTVKEPDLTLPVEERPIGGLGLHLLRKLCKKIVYRFDNGHNILKVWIDLQADEEDAQT